MRLNEFQIAFKDLMLDHPNALNAPPSNLAEFCESGDIDLPTRLKVYRNNIVGSLTDLMVATFPLIKNLVGQEFLEGMARSFILAHPPQSGCLNLYGEGFGDFIEHFSPAASLPYLPDMARYELAMNAAYYARDCQPLLTNDLAAIAPDDLGDIVLKLRASAHLKQSRFLLTAIKAFCDNNGEGQLDLDQGGEKLMVYRPKLEVKSVILDEDEFACLSLLNDRQTLGNAVEQILIQYPAFDFQAFLQKHLALGTFQAFE